jgi:predicted extracellular nuclease
MVLVMALNLAPAPQATEAAIPTELFFSEYIEGTSNNKALEIYNGTGAAIELATGGYKIQMYFNGSASFGLKIDLTGTVIPGDVYVIAQSSANAAILAQADQTNGAGWYNGNDAVVLLKGTTVLDVIGQIGFNPGTEWGSGLISTADNTLRRLPSVCAGDPNGSDAFVPSLEWVGYATDTFDGLGEHVANCEPEALQPKINEFSASTTGTDVEYVEVFGTPNTDYSAYTILEVEGDTTGSGVVDEIMDVGTTDDAGFWLGNLPANALENGTLSLLMVKNFTGTFGADLDTNNDGIFDTTPWDVIVDSVAVNDGGSGDFTYGVPSLGVSYDGLPYAPGGASRFPDGLDTDTATDWVRNDFDLAGITGYAGTIVLGEAYNTPGMPNEIYLPPSEMCGDPFTAIYDVQGSGLESPLVGTEVALEGIVVGDFQNNTATDNGNLNGFHVQDPIGDGNPATSDGIFIYYPSGTTDVTVGTAVRVRGVVSEYNGMTEVTVSQLWTCSSGNSVAPTALSLPVTNLDDFEPYEGMLVTFPQTLYISEYFNFDRYGEIVLTSDRLYQPTAIYDPGTPEQAALAQANTLSRITLDDGRSTQNPDPAIHPNGAVFDMNNLFRGGDMVTNVTGVLDYSFNLYRIQPTQGADYAPVNSRPVAPEVVSGRVQVAAMNTLNYFLTIDTGAFICGPDQDMECRGADTADELARQRAKLLAAVAGLDAAVIGLNEMENTPGVEPLADIVAGLNAMLGEGTYAYIDTGVIGTDAIRVGLIYKPGLVTSVGDFALLTSDVDPRFLDDYNRPSLAQTFEENSTGARFTVSINHLKSKGSDCNDVGDPDLGDGAGNCNLTRKYAAQALVDWLASDPTGSGDPDFIILGDLNSYTMEDPIDAIIAGPDDILGTEDDYVNMILYYQGLDAYSYVFDGQLGYLDHALASPSMAAQISGATDWHINADEPDLIDYDMTFKQDAQDALYAPDMYRTSDHDPVVLGLDLLNLPPTVEAGGPYSTRVNSGVWVSAVGLDPEGKDLVYAWDLDNNGFFETPGYEAWYQAGPEAGMFPIAVQVTDVGGLTTVDYAVVAVYDPAGEFVTGGGWINAPDGKGEFSFDAKYTKKNPYPVGAVSYLVESSGLYFASTSFDWLVVAGGNSWIHGTGSLDGVGGYVFLLSAVDGDEDFGGDGTDYFRIQIWDASGVLVYDSDPGSAVYAPPITPLGGGSITVH